MPTNVNVVILKLVDLTGSQLDSTALCSELQQTLSDSGEKAILWHYIAISYALHIDINVHSAPYFGETYLHPLRYRRLCFQVLFDEVRSDPLMWSETVGLRTRPV